jgi:hypothetical protein
LMLAAAVITVVPAGPAGGWLGFADVAHPDNISAPDTIRT